MTLQELLKWQTTADQTIAPPSAAVTTATNNNQCNTSHSQSVSLVLTKLRIRYKDHHECRRAADMGLTLLSFAWPFYILRGLFYLHHGAVICKLFLVNLVHVMHGRLMFTYNYLISSCAYPGWAWHKIIMDVQFE